MEKKSVFTDWAILHKNDKTDEEIRKLNRNAQTQTVNAIKI